MGQTLGQREIHFGGLTQRRRREATPASEALSGPVASRPRASAGPAPRPGRPSTARPEYCGARGEPILSEPPELPVRRSQRDEWGRQLRGRQLRQSYYRLRRLTSLDLVEGNPKLCRPDSPPYTQNGFLPRRSGFLIRIRHCLTPFSPLQSSSPRGPHRPRASRHLKGRWTRSGRTEANGRRRGAHGTRTQILSPPFLRGETACIPSSTKI